MRAVVGGAWIVTLARVCPARCRAWLPVAPPYGKVFVVGCARSGTTWVQNLLQAHPRAIGTEESYAVPRAMNAMSHRPRVIAVARLLYGYDRARVLGRDVGLHYYVTRARLSRFAAGALATQASDWERTICLVRAIFDQYWSEHGGTPASVLIEKTPTHLPFADALLDSFAEAKVIEVLRDGRDVVASMQAIPHGDSWLPNDFLDQVASWVTCAERGWSLGRRPDAGERVATVRYEDLHQDATRELARLFSFLEIDIADQDVASIVDEFEFETARRTGKGRFLRTGSVGTWLDQLDNDQVATFSTIAGDALRRRGYGDVGAGA
jgi:hypothetical protein